MVVPARPSHLQDQRIGSKNIAVRSRQGYAREVPGHTKSFLTGVHCLRRQASTHISPPQGAPRPATAAVPRHDLLVEGCPCGATRSRQVIFECSGACSPSPVQISQFPNFSIGIGGRGGSPLAAGGSGRNRFGIRLRVENTSSSWSTGNGSGAHRHAEVRRSQSTDFDCGSPAKAPHHFTFDSPRQWVG
jgi:hypothetical protein